MPKAPRVFNRTSGRWLKRGAAERAVESCAAVWVDETHAELRNLTLAESIEARKAQARLGERKPLAELYGVRYQEPLSALPTADERRQLVWDANAFGRRSDGVNVGAR